MSGIFGSRQTPVLVRKLSSSADAMAWPYLVKLKQNKAPSACLEPTSKAGAGI